MRAFETSGGGRRGQAARDESSAAQLFAPLSAVNSALGVSGALSMWADRCFDLGLHDLAVDLLDAAELTFMAQIGRRVSPRRAMYLLHAGRFAEALATLPGMDPGLPTRSADVSVEHLVRAAAQAALGNNNARDWLVLMSSQLVHSDLAGPLALCLMRVGQARGDQGLSDAAYRQLPVLGVTDRETAPMVAALTILRRDPVNADAAHENLSEAIAVLQSSCGPFADDAQPALDTAAELVRRGDAAGAVLLLTWVSRLNPQLDRVKASFAPLSPRKVGWSRGMLISAAWSAAAVVSVFGLFFHVAAAALPMVAGVLLWQRFVPMRGMSLTDSRVYRRLRLLRPHPWSAQELKRLEIAAVVSAMVGAAWSVIAQAGVSSRLGVGWNDVPLWIAVPIWVLGIAGVPTVVWMIFWRLRQRRLAKEERERTARLERDVSRGRCLCWRADQLYGAVAVASLGHHLRPIALPPVLEQLSHTYPQHQLLVASCNQSGAAWLRVLTSEEGSFYLFRTPLEPPGWTAEDPSDNSNLNTGLYL